jgi:hypothetical protein
MRIAGVHIERSILVVRDDKSNKVSYFKFETLEKLFKSKEVKKCDSIYINAGENNFLVKAKFFPNKNPEQAKNYVLNHLAEFSVGKGKEYVIKVTVVPKEDASYVYIIEGKEEQIYARVVDLPVENYRISGVIPDNFAISYPFMLEEGLDGPVLIVEVGAEELILNCVDKKIITFTRSAFFEKKDLLDSLRKEIEILLHKVGPVKSIYFTGKLAERKFKKLKKEFSSYKNKIKKFIGPEGLSSDSILAYGLSLSPVMAFNNDLSPEYIAVGREEWNKDAKLRKSYEKVEKIQAEVGELRDKLKLHEETRTPIPWGLFLSEISRSIPDNVCLIELESEPTIMENKKGFIFHLTGEGKTQEAVMEFYSEIQNIDIIDETSIKRIKNEKGITSYVFTVVLYSE